MSCLPKIPCRKYESGYVGIGNNVEEEEKKELQINQKHQKLCGKLLGKITEPHTNLLFIREIT